MSQLPPIADQPCEERSRQHNQPNPAQRCCRIAVGRASRCIISCKQRGRLIRIWSTCNRRRSALFTRPFYFILLRRSFPLRAPCLSPCFLPQLLPPPFRF